ncbi:MAG: agmatinase [Methylacidiphilales bacterium]|nr:agmatinase [Candidatus Methylacidiphilales bacterium]
MKKQIFRHQRKDLGVSGDQAFRSEELLGKYTESVYAGTVSFLRRKLTRDLKGADIAVTGIPFDSATTGRSGARLGPRAIRIASTTLAELDAFPQSIDPCSLLAIADYGDCYFELEQLHNIVPIAEAHIKSILAQGAMALTLGGDHFITYPCLRAYHAHYPQLALIHFDAHPDTWDDAGGLNHGTMFTRAVNEKLIDPNHSIQIGIRTLVEDDRGIKIVSAEDVGSLGAQAVAEMIIERTAGLPCYLTFDIDALDPAFAPGTGTPVSGGLTSREALSIIRKLAPLSIVGMDIVEVAPAYDHAEITALAAAHIAYDVICLIAQNKASRSG